MDDERGVAGNFVTRRAFAGAADMQVAGEDQIYTAARKAGHSHVRASDQTVNLMGFGQIEGMMGDDDTCAILAACFELRATAGDLLAANAAIFKGERAGGIDACDRDFIVAVERLKFVADVELVISKRFQRACQNVV